MKPHELPLLYSSEHLELIYMDLSKNFIENILLLGCICFGDLPLLLSLLLNSQMPSELSTEDRRKAVGDYLL